MTAKIVRMTPSDKGKLRAFFTVAVNDFEIEGMKLIDGKNGMFVAFPSRSYDAKDGTTKYTDIVKTSNKTIVQDIIDAAVAEYERRGDDITPTKTAAVSVSLDDEEDDDLPF